MGDADKVAILSRTNPGSTPQEALALVAKMSDSERSVFESGRRGRLAEDNTTSPEIRYRASIHHFYFSSVTFCLLVESVLPTLRQRF